MFLRGAAPRAAAVSRAHMANTVYHIDQWIQVVLIVLRVAWRADGERNLVVGRGSERSSRSLPCGQAFASLCQALADIITVFLHHNPPYSSLFHRSVAFLRSSRYQASSCVRRSAQHAMIKVSVTVARCGSLAATSYAHPDKDACNSQDSNASAPDSVLGDRSSCQGSY